MFQDLIGRTQGGGSCKVYPPLKGVADRSRRESQIRYETVEGKKAIWFQRTSVETGKFQPWRKWHSVSCATPSKLLASRPGVGVSNHIRDARNHESLLPGGGIEM